MCLTIVGHTICTMAIPTLMDKIFYDSVFFNINTKTHRTECGRETEIETDTTINSIFKFVG